MRSAIGKIKMRAPMDGDDFLQYYERIKDKLHSQGTFEYPGQEIDRLYEAVIEGDEPR